MKPHWVKGSIAAFNAHMPCSLSLQPAAEAIQHTGGPFRTTNAKLQGLWNRPQYLTPCTCQPSGMTSPENRPGTSNVHWMCNSAFPQLCQPCSVLLPVHTCLLYLEKPLKTALLYCLTRQDVRELRVGVRDEETGSHILLDELCDLHFRARADTGARGRAMRLASI